MNTKIILMSIAIGGAVMIGCDEGPNSKPPTPAAGTESGSSALPKVDTAAIADKAAEVKDDVKAGAETAMSETAAAAEKAKTEGAAAVESAKETADSATDAIVQQAQTTFDQVKNYVNEKKFTDADALLKKLEGVQDKLPESIKAQIPKLRQAIDAGNKALGAFTTPPAN